jgi:hypothetical protein
MVDLTGRTVYSKAGKNNQFLIGTGKFANGVYVINVFDKTTNQSIAKKIATMHECVYNPIKKVSVSTPSA